MRRVFLFIAVLVAASGGAAWLAVARQATVSGAAGALVPVTATFYPLAEAARRIGGSRVQVVILTPPGAEPHDYEPTPRDIARIGNKGLFLMNGGIDAWAERLLPDLHARGVRIVRIADRLPEVSKDPHVWIDPVRAKEIAGSILDALVQEDPVHEVEYRANAQAYSQDLEALNRAYAEGLKECTVRTVVSSHDALEYLAARYTFENVPIAGFDPEQEPSTRQMADIATAARKAGVRRIFFETLASPKLASAIAEELGIGTAVFDPVEGLATEASASGETYFSIMRRNLDALREAMLCR